MDHYRFIFSPITTLFRVCIADCCRGFSYSLNCKPKNNKCSSPRKDKNNKPPTGENLVPCKRNIEVNPNGRKQGGINKKESPGIANPKSDPNRRKTKLVPRRPWGNSNKDPSGSNSEAPAKTKRNTRKVISFEFHAQVQSERAPKGNKFLGA